MYIRLNWGEMFEGEYKEPVYKTIENVKTYKNLKFEYVVPKGKIFDVGDFTFRRMYAPFDYEPFAVIEDYFIEGKRKKHHYGALVYKEKFNLINDGGAMKFEIVYNIQVDELVYRKEIESEPFEFNEGILRRGAERCILKIIDKFIRESQEVEPLQHRQCKK